MTEEEKEKEIDNDIALITTEKDKISFDDVLAILGEFGLYQKVSYFLFSLPYVFTSMQLLGWVFTGANLPHQCKLPPTKFVNSSACSLTFINGSETNCIYGYEYDTTQIGDSVVKEWNLVCDDSKWKATVGAAPMVGYLFGGFIFGCLSDKIGRKPTFLISNALLLLAGLGTAMAPEYYSFTLGRALAGASIAGVEASCFVMGMELVGPSKRTQAGIICWFFETTGLLLTVTLAYGFSYNWRLLQTLYSIPNVMFFVYIWIAPESIRFLLGKKKI